MEMVQKFLSGRKTIMVAVGMIGYIAVQAINGQEPDPVVINSMLAAMGLTIRAAISKSGPAKP